MLNRTFPNNILPCHQADKPQACQKILGIIKKKKKNQSLINKFYTQCLCGFATILRKKNAFTWVVKAVMKSEFLATPGSTLNRYCRARRARDAGKIYD